MPQDLEAWLREACSGYVFDLRGVYRRSGDHTWPITAGDEGDLEAQLAAGGHLLPLPKEPAALANVLEVSIVDYLLVQLGVLRRQAGYEDDDLEGAVGRRGTERGYPDIEIEGGLFGGGFHAVDIKVAQRKVGVRGPSKNTQSRITLYTGNTYFRHPSLHWPGTFRPFADYASHLDVLGIYTLTETAERVAGLELIVQPPWRIASKERSSTTREYIGAVMEVEALRQGRGEFETADAFYKYWRKYKFKVGQAVQQQLDKLSRGNQAPPGVVEPPPNELPL